MPKLLKEYWRWLLGIPFALITMWVVWHFFTPPTAVVRVPIRAHHTIGDAFGAAKYWMILAAVLLVISAVIYFVRKIPKSSADETHTPAAHDPHTKKEHPPKSAGHGDGGGGHDDGHGHGGGITLSTVILLMALAAFATWYYFSARTSQGHHEYQVTVASPSSTSASSFSASPKEDPCDERIHPPKKYAPYVATASWSTENNIPLPSETRSCLLHLDQLDIRCRPDDGTDEDGWGACNAQSMHLEFRSRNGIQVSTGAWYLDADGNEVAVE